MGKKNRSRNNSNSKNRGLSSVGSSVSPSELSNKMETLELMNEIYSSSVPRNLTFSSMMQNTYKATSRDVIFRERREIYNDPFTRNCVSTIIARAIGTTHDNIRPFQINLQNTELPDAVLETVRTELKNLSILIDKTLLETTMDSQFYSDGYTKLEVVPKEGIVDIILNTSTKPYNVTPYITNKNKAIAYEVSPNLSMMGATKNDFGIDKNGRKFVTPISVGRINALSNGIRDLTTESIISVERMNAFEEKEMPYEDIIFGGVIEGVTESYENYIWAINALANLRITSNKRERFITHTLNGVGDQERKLLKEMLETQIKIVSDKSKERVESKDSMAFEANYIIPTTGENATNNIAIQESSPELSGLANIDDIKFHILRYMADLGFDINLTPFADQKVGGNEKDGATQNSMQMDAQGELIRKSIREYILHIVRVHFLAKYNLEIDLSKVEVTFTSVLNQAKINAETQRMEALSNVQQLGGMIETFKTVGFEDSPEEKELLKSLIIDTLSQTTEDREKTADTLVEVMLRKPKEPEGEAL